MAVLKKIALVVTVLLAICGVGGIFLVIEIAVMNKSANEMRSMHLTISRVCPPNLFGERAKCESTAHLEYLRCMNPFLSPPERKACFNARAAVAVHEMLPELADPNFTDDQVLAWVSRTISKMQPLDLSFLRYHDAIVPERRLGYEESLYHQLEASDFVHQTQVMKGISEDKISATFRLTDSPKIDDRGVKGGIYTWTVGVPGEIDFHAVDFNATVTVPDSMPAGFLIDLVRADPSQNPDGLGITNYAIRLGDPHATDWTKSSPSSAPIKY